MITLNNEKNEKTLSTYIDELSEKAELADTDDILIKGKGVNALKTTLLAIFCYINQKLQLGSLAAKNKIEKEDLDTSLSLELELAFGKKLDIAQKGTANGVAELDSNGFIHSVQLPSFVDDVIEGYLHTDGNFYSDEAHTNEVLAESGKIYIDLTGSINKTYRWSGTAYVVISDTITLGVTERTAFRGDRGKLAYEHTLPESGTNPHGTTKADIGLSNVENVIANNAVIAYTEPDGPAEGDTESIPASGSTLKVIIGWLMKEVKTAATAIINLSQLLDVLNYNIETYKALAYSSKLSVLNDALFIDTTNPYADINMAKQRLYTGSGTTSMPPGCTLGIREFLHFNDNWFVLKITELSPQLGRTWYRRYDRSISQWDAAWGEISNVNNKLFASTYTIQNSSLFAITQLYYAKSGNIVHVYFSGKTAGELPANTQITAPSLPAAAIQQDCVAIMPYGQRAVNVFVNNTTANMIVLSNIPSDTWVRFNFAYITPV